MRDAKGVLVHDSAEPEYDQFQDFTQMAKLFR